MDSVAMNPVLSIPSPQEWPPPLPLMRGMPRPELKRRQIYVTHGLADGVTPIHLARESVICMPIQ
jgi:hypothetical protein